MSRRTRWLVGLAILGAIVIGVARTVEIPGVKQFIHPRVECQDSPECRAYIDERTISPAELRAALARALAGLGIPADEIKRRLSPELSGSHNPTDKPADKGGDSSSGPPGSPPGGGHNGGPPSPPSPPPTTTTPPPTTVPKPGPVDRVCHLTRLGERVCHVVGLQ